tara:strand:+ start:79 stop:240 length:162 start_codon:yes stop_codon:yes gene_type:complete
MSTAQFDELLDLFATMKDEQIELREELNSTREQVALLSEALIKSIPDIGQEYI